MILPTITGQENRKKRSCIQEFNRNIPKMFQVVLWLMCNHCWKFHENPFIHFPVMLLTDTDFPEHVKMFPVFTGLNGTSQNVPDYSWYQVPPNLKISWKSVHAFSVMFLTDRPTNRHTHKPTEMKTLPSPFAGGKNEMRDWWYRRWYKAHRIRTFKCFSYRLAVVFAQSIEAMC